GRGGHAAVAPSQMCPHVPGKGGMGDDDDVSDVRTVELEQMVEHWLAVDRHQGLWHADAKPGPQTRSRHYQQSHAEDDSSWSQRGRESEAAFTRSRYTSMLSG